MQRQLAFFVRKSYKRFSNHSEEVHSCVIFLCISDEQGTVMFLWVPKELESALRFLLH